MDIHENATWVMNYGEATGYLIGAEVNTQIGLKWTAAIGAAKLRLND
jgi:hypothetical protein